MAGKFSIVILCAVFFTADLSAYQPTAFVSWPGQIVAVGDSLSCQFLGTNGWRVCGGYANTTAVEYVDGRARYFNGPAADINASWLTLLTNKFSAIGREVSLDNAGCVPSITAKQIAFGGNGVGILSRFYPPYVAANAPSVMNWTAQLAPTNSEATKWLFVLAGGNDVFDWTGDASIYYRLSTICSQAKQQGYVVVLLTYPLNFDMHVPHSVGSDAIPILNALDNRLRTNPPPVDLLVDLAGFMTTNGYDLVSSNYIDGIHPTTWLAAQWTDFIFSALTNNVANPGISKNPADILLTAGSPTKLSVKAIGSASLNYCWFHDGHEICGATNAEFCIPSLAHENCGNYFVIVSNELGAATSSVATVAMAIPPAISQEPQVQSVTSGAAVVMAAPASGWPPPNYQWYLNGNKLTGATNATLTLKNAFVPDAGAYSVVADNGFGTVTSTPAVLVVAPFSITSSNLRSDGRFQMQFNTLSNVDYTIEFSTNLNAWNALLTITGTGAPLTVNDPNTVGSAQRFYRVGLATPP